MADTVVLGITSRPKSLYDVKNPSAFLAKQRKKAHEIERQMSTSMQQHAAKIKQAKEAFAQWDALFKIDDPTVRSPSFSFFRLRLSHL